MCSKIPSCDWYGRHLTAGQYATIIKLLMLTAQRVNEIAGLRWSEIDFARGVISLPAERTRMPGPMKYQCRPTLEPCSRRSRRLTVATSYSVSPAADLSPVVTV